MLQLLKLQWKESFRSTVWQKNLAINIVMGFFIIYFMLLFLGLGILFSAKLIPEFYPGEDPIHVFNGFIVMYLLADLGMRFFLQDLPTLSIQPFLYLPISRKKLVHYLLIKSGNSLFNVLPFFTLVPFAIITITPDYGSGTAMLWLASLFFLVLTNNYITTYFKRQMAKNMKITAGFAGVVIALGALNYFNIIDLSGLSASIFDFVLVNPWMLAVFAGLFAAVYFLNFQFLHANAYMEEISTKKETKADTFTNLSVLDRFGEIGRLITLEIKLIMRHKRPRTLLVMAPFFLAYGLIFYTNDIYLEGFAWLMFAGIFITGMFLMNYGQFLYAWESEHFDALLAHNVDTKNYIKAKFFLLTPVVVVSFLFSLLYGFITVKAIPINIAMTLFNVGVSSFTLMYLSTNNSKRMDLSKGGAMNWQGVGANQFIMGLPIMIAPLLIFAPFSYFDMPYVGLAIVGGLGLVGLLFFDTWINIITKRFKAQKYRMAAGFRKQE